MSTFNRISTLRRAVAVAKGENPAILSILKTWEVLEGLVCKRDFTPAKRKEAAKSGAAMSDGSFPIENTEDLHNAIGLSGMSSHPASEVRAHIKSRAKALNIEGELPASWGDSVAKADDADDKKDEKPSAGIKVTNNGDPKYGVYEHELGGQKIGHTVNVTGQGWTAVPTEGEIKGKFKKHVDAQQYLADNHVENTKTQMIEEAAQAKPKVKKDEVEKGGPGSGPRKGSGQNQGKSPGNWADRLDTATQDAIDSVRDGTRKAVFSGGQKAMAIIDAIKKLKKDGEDNEPGDSKTSTTEVEKAAEIVAKITQIRKDWGKFDQDRAGQATRMSKDALTTALNSHGGRAIGNARKAHDATLKASVAGSTPDDHAAARDAHTVAANYLTNQAGRGFPNSAKNTEMAAAHQSIADHHDYHTHTGGVHPEFFNED